MRKLFRLYRHFLKPQSHWGISATLPGSVVGCGELPDGKFQFLALLEITGAYRKSEVYWDLPGICFNPVLFLGLPCDACAGVWPGRKCRAQQTTAEMQYVAVDTRQMD